MEESNRQKKIAGILQKDIADTIQSLLRNAGIQNILISVTQVKVTVDLTIAKVYLSIFPNKDTETILEEVKALSPHIKHKLAQLTRHQLRMMPELLYFLDDSLEYIQKIDDAVKGKDNPLRTPDLLEKRKRK